VSFYRKSAGVLQEEPKQDFRGLVVEKWGESGNGEGMRM